MTRHIMRQKLLSKIVSTPFSSQSLASYLAETRRDIGEMTFRSNVCQCGVPIYEKYGAMWSHNQLPPIDKLAGQRDRKKFNPGHSLEIFMKRYKLQLSAYAYQLLGDHDAVEDVLQQTWIDLYLRLHRYGEL